MFRIFGLHWNWVARPTRQTPAPKVFRIFGLHWNCKPVLLGRMYGTEGVPHLRSSLELSLLADGHVVTTEGVPHLRSSLEQCNEKLLRRSRKPKVFRIFGLHWNVSLTDDHRQRTPKVFRIFGLHWNYSPTP